MADDYGDKTEAPTPRRRTEAREQGNIARSQDLTIALLLLGIMVMLRATGPKMVTALKTLVAEMLGSGGFSDLSSGGAAAVLLRAVWLAAAALTPLLIAVTIIAIAANLLQVGFNFSTKRLQPNFAALNPFRDIRRIFGGRGPGQIVLNVLKLVLLSAVGYSALHGRIDQITSVQQLSFIQIFGLGAEIVYSIAIRIGLAMLVLAVIDYAHQKWRVEQQLKMTRQEVKDEMRRMEGDPKIKQRRRQIALQMLTQKLKKDVPTADVIVTNPTEFAVALKYEGDSMHAPLVVAKGQGLIAQRIREIAIAAGVPILERKPLARALYKLVEVGQQIPEQFYSAVAEILAYVYELTGKVKRRPAAEPLGSVSR